MVGRTFGHYQITSRLGKSGKVCKARDTRLGRITKIHELIMGLA